MIINLANGELGMPDEIKDEIKDELKIGERVIRLLKGDITNLGFEAFVYYARPDLVLGTGFSGAIGVRGGATIQEELKKFRTVETGAAVVTSAGNMKSKYIIHAVGPRFQEEETESKLRTTVRNALQRAEERGVRILAFPAMGTGFYGVPLDLSARATLETAKEYLPDAASLREVIFCLQDTREYQAFQARLQKMGEGK